MITITDHSYLAILSKWDVETWSHLAAITVIKFGPINCFSKLRFWKWIVTKRCLIDAIEWALISDNCTVRYTDVPEQCFPNFFHCGTQMPEIYVADHTVQFRGGPFRVSFDQEIAMVSRIVRDFWWTNLWEHYSRTMLPGHRSWQIYFICRMI